MNLDSLFHQIIKPALGCTEPVAVALATAAAVQTTAGWTPVADHFHALTVSEANVRSVHVRVSRNVFKNAFAIRIPNASGHKGILMSAALGVFCDPAKRLGLFEDLTDEKVEAATELVQSGRVQVSIAENAPSDLYIHVEVELQAGRGECTIRDEHANFASLRRDGGQVYGSDELAEPDHSYSPEVAELKSLSVAQVVALVDHLPQETLDLLRTTMEKNIQACKAGLSEPTGIGAGYYGVSGGAPGNLSQYISSLTAAGSDARMAGQPLEIMTSAGSGNQGIVATIPVVAYGRMQMLDELTLLKSLALSHLMTMYITAYVGYLSALCGVAIKAGIGAACGIAYAMGGGVEDIERTIKIMAATLTGMVCDGAKIGCALKASTATDMAIRAATLALRKAEVPDDNGIVGTTAEQTIRNFAELGRSMEVVDAKLIDIMLAKMTS